MKNCGLLLIYFIPGILWSQALYKDISIESGVNERGTNYGVAVGDFDLDGWEDIYVSQWDGPNRLYKNIDGTHFQEVAAAYGLDLIQSSKIVLWGDVNNDGRLDLFVGNYTEPDILLLNERDETGKPSFREFPLPEKVASDAHVMAAMFGDIDKDGWLDLYVARSNTGNTLYKNYFGERFEDVIEEVGASDTLLTMGAIFFDYDNDRDLDIYLVHDGYQANLLYENDGTGHFEDVASEKGADVKSFGMGVDAGDLNNDGWLDLYITNLYANTLLLNKGDGTYKDISELAGVMDEGMGWGTSFLDVNNDGLQDIYMVNTTGYPNSLFQNMGDLQFDRKNGGPNMSMTGNSFGMATGDFNKDGWVDVFVSYSREIWGNMLFQHLGNETQNWLKVKLEGTISNRSAIGARIEGWYQGKAFVEEVASGVGYAGQNSLIQHLGLGDVEVLDSLIIYWPSGKIERFVQLSTNKLYHFTENLGLTSLKNPPKGENTTLFYPNPVKQAIAIDLAIRNSGKYELLLRDMLGREVFSWNYFLLAGDQHIGQVLPEGINGFYFAELRNEDYSFVQKIYIDTR